MLDRRETEKKARELLEIFALWGLSNQDSMAIARDMVRLLALREYRKDKDDGKTNTKPARH